jgi:hypothetical protein
MSSLAALLKKQQESKSQGGEVGTASPDVKPSGETSAAAASTANAAVGSPAQNAVPATAIKLGGMVLPKKQAAAPLVSQSAAPPLEPVKEVMPPSSAPIVSTPVLPSKKDEAVLPPMPSIDAPIVGAFMQTELADAPKVESELQEAFLRNVKSIKDLFDQPELLAAAMRQVLVDLRDNPQFEGLMGHEDVGMMVRAMREAFGVAVVKKEERSKGKGRTKKAKELEGDAAVFSKDLAVLANLEL